MKSTSPTQDTRDVGNGVSVPPVGEPVGEPVAPWEQIAEGRYMPRRIRGSCIGRELG